MFSSHRTRLNFFTGKGGVGKTTLSCAAALQAANQGFSTLLMAVSPPSPVQRYLGDRHTAFHGLHEIQKNLWAMNLDENWLFDNFIRHSLKIKKIYNAVLNSPIYRYFTAVAPGIKELMTQEVIIDALRRNATFNHLFFDMIFIDSPATGHGLAWFSVPDAVITTFPLGPLNKKAREIRRVFQNSELTSIHLVTLPEEMPVNETIEYYRSLTEKVGLPVKRLFLNGVFPKLSTDYDSIASIVEVLSNRIHAISPEMRDDADSLCLDLTTSSHFYQSRRELIRKYRQLIQSQLPIPVIEIPMIFYRESHLSLLQTVGESLETAEV